MCISQFKSLDLNRVSTLYAGKGAGIVKGAGTVGRVWGWLCLSGYVKLLINEKKKKVISCNLYSLFGNSQWLEITFFLPFSIRVSL